MSFFFPDSNQNLNFYYYGILEIEGIGHWCWWHQNINFTSSKFLFNSISFFLSSFWNSINTAYAYIMAGLKCGAQEKSSHEFLSENASNAKKSWRRTSDMKKKWKINEKRVRQKRIISKPIPYNGPRLPLFPMGGGGHTDFDKMVIFFHLITEMPQDFKETCKTKLY